MALRLRGATSGYIELKAPASAGDNTLTLPTNNGSANQLLKTDGNGNLTWVDSATSIGGATGVAFNDGVKTRWGSQGAGYDLEIYHVAGDKSLIRNVSSNLELWSQGVNIQGEAGSAYTAKFHVSNGCELLHNTHKKIETSSTGVTVTGSVIADNTPGRNLIINGGMKVAQRGTDTAKLYDYCGPDRFYFGGDGSQRSTISQANLAIDSKGQANAWRMEVTTASGSPSAGNFQVLQYRFEGQDLQHLKKGTANAEALTLQFWVKSPKTGIHIVELADQDNSRHISKSYTVSSANTWQKVVITFAGDTTGAFGNDTARSLDLVFWLMAGSTYSSGTLATSWASSTNANKAVGQVNCVDSTSNNFYLTGVQLEVGSAATDFEHRSYGDELVRCQRYYNRQNLTQWGSIETGVFTGSAQIRGTIGQFPVTMRATPSITFNALAADREVGSSSTVTAVASNYLNPSGGAISWTINSHATGSSGDACAILATHASDSYIAYAAEL